MKTKLKTKLVVLVALIITTFISCKKEGTGGDATVATIIQHHGKNIPFSTVYIKYNAKDFPGEDVSKYDANQKTDIEGHTHFEGLQKGDYYFYAIGYDSASAAIVKGGVGYKISRKKRKEKHELFVSVTE